MKLTSRPLSQNVESNPTNWRAFMAEQMRNIPPLAWEPQPPRPGGGDLGRLYNSADEAIMHAVMQGQGPQPDYRMPMPDEEPYDTTIPHR